MAKNKHVQTQSSVLRIEEFYSRGDYLSVKKMLAHLDIKDFSKREKQTLQHLKNAITLDTNIYWVGAISTLFFIGVMLVVGI